MGGVGLEEISEERPIMSYDFYPVRLFDIITLISAHRMQGNGT